MSQATVAHPMLFGEPSESAIGAFRWLSPAMIGLSAPLAFGLVLFPGAIDHARAALSALLFVLLLVCVAAYVVSVILPGEISGLLVDRSERQIELITDGMFATGRRAVAFEDVTDLRMTKQYDDDGYAYEVAELRLESGETIALPSTISAADVAVARRALGFAAPTRR
jgi:hypothetical protein